jgi:hypothetical protein
MMKIEIKVDDLYFCSELLVKPEPLLIKAETAETQLPSAPLVAILLLCVRAIVD